MHELTEDLGQRDEPPRLQHSDPDRVVEAAFRRAARLSGVDVGFVFLPDHDGGLWPRWHFGVEEGSLDGLPPLEADATSVTGRCVSTGRTRVVSEGPEDPGWHPEWRRVFPLQEGVAVPLFLEDREMGAFLVGWYKPLQVDDRAVAVVEGVAYQAAAALQHAERMERAERGQRHLLELIETLPVPLVVIDDQQRRVERLNAEGRRLFGEVEGREVCEIVAERRFRSLGGRELEPDQVACALALSSWKEGFRIRMSAVDGTERIVAVSVVPQAADGSTLVAFRDTTSEFGFEEKRARFVEAAVGELESPLKEVEAFCQLLLSRFGEGREPLAAETTEALRAAVGRLSAYGAILGSVAGLRPVHPSEMRTEAPNDLVRAAWETVGGRRTDVRADGDEVEVRCAPRLAVRALAEVLGSVRQAGARWVETEVGADHGVVRIEGRTLPYQRDELTDPAGLDLRLGMARAILEATGGTLEVDRGTGSFSLCLPAHPERG